MKGYTLRILGALSIMLGLICLLSGWSVLFATEGAVFTLIQFGMVAAGLYLVYRGENLPPVTRR